MSQRIRCLRDWAKTNLSGIVQEKVLDLCAKKAEWSLWYDHEGAYTTSHALDRLMRFQDGYFDSGQHFHGDLAFMVTWHRQIYVVVLGRFYTITGRGLRSRWRTIMGHDVRRSG